MFEIKTNWIVLTGAPCSGKTTLIKALASHAYKTHFEIARDYINRKLLLGLTIEQIRSDEFLFQTEILAEKLHLENTLNPFSTVFLDRGMPDSLAYFQLANLPVESVKKACLKYQYKKVVFCEKLKLIHDEARCESQKVVDELDKLLKTAYLELGYQLVYLPALPLNERLELLLKLCF